MKKILIIQTAFIGDVILATSLIDLTKRYFPQSEISFVLRKGNEKLLKNNPHISKIYIWDKKESKIKNLFKILKEVRKEKFDIVLNIQRFFSSGLLTAFSKARVKIGFNKNPLSLFFNFKVKHHIPHIENKVALHEVQRNALLLQPLIKEFNLPIPTKIRPNLYLVEEDFKNIKKYKENEYIVMAPSSVWFTKQWSKEKWQNLIRETSKDYKILLIGGPDDSNYINEIMSDSPNTENLCGELNLVESAALMKNAKRVFVNDSAPLHLASAVNAKVTAIFCSTIPEFGYFPVSEYSKVVERQNRLECTPCGLHGKKECPLGHFKCSNDISIQSVLDTIN